jgi:hypothetical protein
MARDVPRPPPTGLKARLRLARQRLGVTCVPCVWTIRGRGAIGIFVLKPDASWSKTMSLLLVVLILNGCSIGS